MTIVEEIDKKSGRPHRSKNITDALKYLFKLDKTPQNISEAVKGYSGGGSGITYETVYEGNFEFTGKAPNVSAYEFTGTEELYNSFEFFDGIYEIKVGNEVIRDGCSHGLWNGDTSYKSIGSVKSNKFEIGGEDVSYRAAFSTTQPAGTYSVTLKKIIFPE